MTTADLAPIGRQQALQHPRAGERKLQMQPVETPHHLQVGRRHRTRPIVDTATADAQNLRLLRRAVLHYGDLRIRIDLARPDLIREFLALALTIEPNEVVDRRRL